jgi:spermidine/putrescine transport system ATP-binding protein
MSDGDGVVCARHVSKRFDDVPAVNDVSFVVEKGEFVSLLGPSGCGKSTLLRIIAGFEVADEGSILFKGKDHTHAPPHRRPVNMVFQSYALFPHLTIFDNVAFGLRRKKVPEPEVKQLVHQFLDLVNLPEMSNRYPTQLSGGQQQRVALARALVNRPDVLLLDEPLAALDLKLRKKMQVELKSLQRELGISFVYVTHDQEEALALSDKIGVVNAGHMLQYGPAREVYDHPRSQFVAQFLGEANIIACVVHSAGQRLALHAENEVICVKAPAEPPAVGARVLLAIRPEDIAISAQTMPKDNLYACTIKNKVFAGAAPTTWVSVEGRKTLSVRSADRETFDSLQLGMPAYVGWQATQGVLIRDDGDLR